jgi:hypothetical protein
MALIPRGDRTELVGEIADQAQLHGLLTRIRDLGLDLEGVSLAPEKAAGPSISADHPQQ